MSDSQKRKSIKDIPLPIRKNSDQVSDMKPIAKRPYDDNENDHHIPEKELKEEIHVKERRRTPRVTDSIRLNKTSDTIDLSHEDIHTDREEEPFNPFPNKSNKMKKKKNYTKIFSLLFVAVFVIVIMIMSVFKSASIDVKSRTENISSLDFQQILTNEIVSENNASVFKKVDINVKSELNVDSDEEEFVKEKATGVVTVYNEYSESAQQIVINTRFENSSGQIFKALTAFTIPGYTEPNGKKIPGSVDVEVIAEDFGPEYNIGKTNFTVPGLKGEPQFDTIYAESKTEMAGGIDGVKKIITEDNLNKASEKLKIDVGNELLAHAATKFQDDFVYLDGGQDITYSKIEQSKISGNTVTLTISATNSFIIISKSDLSKIIATNAISNYDGQSDVMIKDFSVLAVSLNEDFENDLDKDISVNISGSNVDIVWKNDVDQIKESISGRKTNTLNEVILDQQGIVGFENVINRPFWSREFPNNFENITINIVE